MKNQMPLNGIIALFYHGLSDLENDFDLDQRAHAVPVRVLSTTNIMPYSNLNPGCCTAKFPGSFKHKINVGKWFGTSFLYYWISASNHFQSIGFSVLFGNHSPWEDVYTVQKDLEMLMTSVKAEEFDVRAEKEFWDEIKRGLVDEEGLRRNHKRKHPVPHGMTKREMWADKEAKSLGVWEPCNSADSPLNSQQQWEAFILLYEMLEEYGTHLVEAAWHHQLNLLLQFSVSNNNFTSYIFRGFHQKQTDILREAFSWVTILWQLGFQHDNPQVRCLIMESFLGIEWMKYGNTAKLVSESFVLGPFIEGLDDPVHHKDFGVKGVYNSKTIEGAAREGIAFLHSLASVAKHHSFGRAGLMGLAECIASAACGVGRHDSGAKWSEDAFPDEVQVECFPEKFSDCRTAFLDVLRFVIESSKQHFNPNYRLQVCEKVLEAAASLVSTLDVPLEILLHFIATLPRAFTDYGGNYAMWIHGFSFTSDFPERFTSSQYLVDGFLSLDDEDLDAWESESKRWARALFLIIKGEHQLAPILRFIQNCGVNICKQQSHLEWLPVKFLVLARSLVAEIQIMQERSAQCGIKMKCRSEISLLDTVDQLCYTEASMINGRIHGLFLFILEELVSFADLSSSIFWSSITKETTLPGSVRGKLGGRSQRRLSTSTTTAILQAITSIQAVACISSWCAQYKSDVNLSSVWNFLWKFFWKTVSSPTCDSEAGAEICLAAYEALAPVLRALVSTSSSLSLDLIRENDEVSAPVVEVKCCLDSLALSFLQNINNLLAVGVLARTRRAVLLNQKWICLESLLSIPYSASWNVLNLEDGSLFFSDSAIRCIFSDLVERLALGLIASGKLDSHVSSCNGVDAQATNACDNPMQTEECSGYTTMMMWRLVNSSWILHVNCNKRRVASIAALLSSVLHRSVFTDEGMHLINNRPGPLKWFVENVIEEGTKSPRTIRLAALHLTGLWLSHPKTIKYYMKELKLLTLYGSVAFDEDFEGELCENQDASTEVSLLAKSPDPELTEAFINTELYARVSVAVLFYKLADLANLVGSANENEDCHAALESGKLFLQELLDSAVNDKDLAKELYKKYSGRNNLPAVRQYLETFAINIYLKFPLLRQKKTRETTGHTLGAANVGRPSINPSGRKRM
ncbi:hypothetical protein NC652_000044 [Populus alba x Populus x berolinensis]|nr:hypothetical protein NC652_000044 [Populus alba x Populus x berolinensis]